MYDQPKKLFGKKDYEKKELSSPSSRNNDLREK
jgi:hypothetical protein